jgi:hypothetical protein
MKGDPSEPSCRGEASHSQELLVNPLQNNLTCAGRAADVPFQGGPSTAHSAGQAEMHRVEIQDEQLHWDVIAKKPPLLVKLRKGRSMVHDGLQFDEVGVHLVGPGERRRKKDAHKLAVRTLEAKLTQEPK